MASFTDTLPQFNPYVQQLPVDAMVKVGMEKQRRYDEGIKKIQTSIDNIAGLDVIKDVHKNYLQSRLNELGSNLKGFAAADFSDNQLVTSVGGMTNQIVGDPVIQNAVSSTKKVRKEQGIMEEARKQGKSSPSNEWYFNNELSDWLSDRNINSSYTGEYRAFVDTDKALLDAIHGAHEDSVAYEENAINADGTINHDVLNHIVKEGLSTTKIKSIARTVYSRPEIKQQLMIDGLYKYKDYTKQDLVDDKQKSLDYQRNEILAMTPKLQTYLTLGDNDRKAMATKDLESGYQKIKSLDAEFAEFRQNVIDNFDAAKVASHMDNKIEEAANNYSWLKSDIESKVSPTFTVNMEKSKFNLEQQKFSETLAMDEWTIKNIKSEIEARDLENTIKLMKAQGKLDENGAPIWEPGKGAINTGDNDKIGKESFKKKIEDMKTNRDQIFRNLISGIGVQYNGKTIYDLYTRDANNNWGINPKYLSGTGFTTEGQAIYDAAMSQLGDKISATGEMHLTGKVDKSYADDIKRWYDLGIVITKQEEAAAAIEKKYNEMPGVVAHDANHALHQYSRDVYSTSWLDDQMINLSEWLSNDDTDETEAAVDNREKEYADLQRQNEASVNTVSLSSTDPKYREAVRLSLLKELQTYAGSDSDGKYGEAINRLTKPDSGNGLTDNNVYSFKYDDKTGKWYGSVLQGSGSSVSGGDFDFEVSPGFVQRWKLNEMVDPKETYFGNSTFGQVLNLYRGNNTLATTTNDITSPEAYKSALNRSNIGNFSVGYQLKAKDISNSQYIPYLYILDKTTGKQYNGVLMDWEKLADLPGLSKTEKSVLKDKPVVYDRLQVVPAVEQFSQIIKGLPNPDAAMKLLIRDYENR